MPKRIGLTRPLLLVVLWASLVGTYSFLSLCKSYPLFSDIPDVPSGLDAALSFAMVVLIAFRVNRAYERWWEARTLWGTLVNVSRNLAVKVRELHQPDANDRRKVRDLIVAFCLGLQDDLRAQADLKRLPGFEKEDTSPKHVPSFIVRKIYAVFQQWNSRGTLSDTHLLILDSEIRVLLDVCGGCERIKTTPMSASWRFFTQQCVFIYLVVLPWGLVDDFGVWTIPLTALVAYVILAAEVIAQHVEEPFGPYEDNLQLESINEAIDRSVSEVLLSENSSDGSNR